MSATDRPRGGSPTRRSFVLAALLGLAPAAFGQVTDADIARAAKSQPVVTDKDIDEAARKHRMPSDAELSRVPVPSAPRLDAVPAPQTQRRVDLGAIAAGYEAMRTPAPIANAGPLLLVFVSFAMPEPALERLVDQAQRSGATLLLRGFVDGSLKKTVERVQRLIGTRKVGFQIDPQAFDRFSVAVAPTFVLVRDGAAAAPCASGTCQPSSAFVSVSGDVSLDYALEHVRRAAPAFGREVGTFLSRLNRRGS